MLIQIYNEGEIQGYYYKMPNATLNIFKKEIKDDSSRFRKKELFCFV